MKDLVDDAVPAKAWAWGDYLLLPAQRRLTRAGQPLEVEDRVLDLLVLLLKHRERALDRQDVIAAIWGKRPVSDATLRQLVYRTRRAMGDDGEHQSAISTLYGRSVQWVAPVDEISQDAPSPGVAAKPSMNGVRSPVAGLADGITGASIDRTGSPDRQAMPSAAVRVAATASAPTDTTMTAPTATTAAAHPGVASRPRALLLVALALLACGVLAAWVYRDPLHGALDALVSAWSGEVPAAGVRQTATLAVLPFLDLDQNQDQRYLSDGLTEELINRLARMPHLRVTARTSSFVFRDKQVDVRDAARKLGVQHVIEGSVQRSGQTWRVRVALVDARNGYELWAGEYNVGAGDLLGMEDQIARSVVTTLYPKLDPGALDARNHLHVNAAAHDYYLVGLQYLSRRTTADINQAIVHFERAVRVDPGYVDAWTGVATGYAVLRDYDADAPPDSHYEDALAAANKAVMLDPESARSLAVLGLLYMRHWQWSQASAEFQRALRLDPNDATAHQWYAIYFWFIGDMQSALTQMRVAYALDPLSPIINVDLSRAMLFAGDKDGAIAQAKAAVALAPHFELAHLFLASALGSKGRYADAVREIRTGIALTPAPASDDLAFLGQMEWAQGDHRDARKLLDEVEARARQHYVSGVALASIEWPLGEKDRAFANLDRAAADHDGLLMTISGIRDEDWSSDPRFAKLLASMNLPVH